MPSTVRLGGLLLAFAMVAAGCDGEPSRRMRSEDPPGVSSSGSSPAKKPDDKGPGRGGNKEENERTVRVPGGATLTSLPRKAEEICTKGPPLSRACPLLVPEIRGTSYLIESFGRPGGRFQVLELAAGAPSNNDFARNAPPRVAHVVVEVGKPGFLIDLGEPYPQKLPISEILGERLDQAQYVTPDPAWGWQESLILAQSFPSGGAHGDHLIYSWKEKGYEHRISLHAWTPARSLVKTLHAIVRSARSP